MSATMSLPIGALPVLKESRRTYRNSAAGFHTGVRPIWWKCRSTLWQARLWLGRENGGPVSLGLYRSEREAHEVWLAVAKRLAVKGMPAPLPLSAWEILMQVPGAKRSTLPRWVYRVGGQFSARARVHGEIREVGVYRSPRAAFMAIWEIIHPLFPLRKPEPRDVAVKSGPGLFDGMN